MWSPKRRATIQNGSDGVVRPISRSKWCHFIISPSRQWTLICTRRHPSFEPGGQTVEPDKLPGGPALDIQFKPRYSIYLESEKQAEFVVNAGISKWHGQPWPSLSTPDAAPRVVFTINLVFNNDLLVSDSVNVSTTDNVFAFNLSNLQPSLDPYEVVLFGATEDGASNVTATSELMFLPEKSKGSVAKLDNLNGGFLFRSPATGNNFEPFLPYGYYASCDRFLCDNDYIQKVKAYKDLGLNSMVSLTTVQNSRATYEYMDTLDLRYMYDLRGSYKNLTAVEEQVSVIRDFEGLYSYWGADEYVTGVAIASCAAESHDDGLTASPGPTATKIPLISSPRRAVSSASLTPTTPSPSPSTAKTSTTRSIRRAPTLSWRTRIP